jgi:hypothetical protein
MAYGKKKSSLKIGLNLAKPENEIEMSDNPSTKRELTHNDGETSDEGGEPGKFNILTCKLGSLGNKFAKPQKEQMSDSDNDSDNSDTDAAKIHQKLVLKGMSKLLRKKKRKVNPFASLLKGFKKKNKPSDQTELQELNESKAPPVEREEKLDLSAGSDSDSDSDDIQESKRNTQQVDNLEL